MRLEMGLGTSHQLLKKSNHSGHIQCWSALRISKSWFSQKMKKRKLQQNVSLSDAKGANSGKKKFYWANISTANLPMETASTCTSSFSEKVKLRHGHVWLLPNPVPCTYQQATALRSAELLKRVVHHGCQRVGHLLPAQIKHQQREKE